MPLRIAAVPVTQREERVALMLGLVGLSGHAAQRPNELSGGQQLLRTVIRSEGITALVATHDPVLIDIADSARLLDDGVLTAL